MDKDDSGALDAAEIHKCLGELDVKCSIRDTKKMIAAADIDGNGDIDLDEAHYSHFRIRIRRDVARKTMKSRLFTTKRT